MKLRLPHKFQAALLAAIASVSFTTLSSGTLGAAFFVSGQAFAEDAEEDPSATIDIGDTNLDAQAAMEEEEGTAEKEPGSAPINEAGFNGGPGNNAGLLITESVDIDETALDTVAGSGQQDTVSGSADATPAENLGFTSNPYATGSDTSNGSDDFSLTGTAPAAAYVPGQSGVYAEEGDSAAGTGSGSSTNKTTAGAIDSIGGTGSGAIGGSVARPMALAAPNMLSPVSSLSVDTGSSSSGTPAVATVGNANAAFANAVWKFENNLNPSISGGTISGLSSTYEGGNASYTASGLASGTAVGNYFLTEDLGYALTFSDGTRLKEGGVAYWANGTGKLAIGSGATNDFTVIAWVKFDSVSGELPIFGTGDGNGSGIAFGLQNGKLDLLAKGKAHHDGYSSSTSLVKANEWVNLAFTYDHTTGESGAYVNGELVGTLTGLNTAGFNTPGGECTYIGVGSTNGDQDNFAGSIAEFSILSGAYTQQEILEAAHLIAQKVEAYTWDGTSEAHAWSDSVWDTESAQDTTFQNGNDAVFGATGNTTVDIATEVTAHNVTVDGQNYTFSLSGSGALNAHGIDIASGCTLTVQGGVVTTGVLAGSGTLSIASGAEVDNTSTSAFSGVKLSGQGLYALKSGSGVMTAGFSDNWAGKVKVSGKVDNLNMENLGTANSTIVLDGWTGSFTGSQNITSDVEIGSGGASINNGSNNTITFAGALTGSGNITRTNDNNNNVNLAFTGDVSGYTGNIIFNRCHDSYSLNVTFSGSANKINAAALMNGDKAAGTFNVTFAAADTVVNSIISRNITNQWQQNKLNVLVNADTTFKKDVTVDSLTIANGKHATFEGATSVKTAASFGGMVTNKGAMTLNGATTVAGTIANQGGSLALNGAVTLNINNIGAFEVFDATAQKYSYAAKGSGFLTSSGQYYLAKGTEGASASHGTSITGGSYVDDAPSKGAGDIIVTFDITPGGTYYVNESMDTHEDVAEGGSYNILSATDVSIKKDVTLTAASSSDSFTPGAKLHGEGTFAFTSELNNVGSTQQLPGALVLDGAGWQGIVQVNGGMMDVGESIQNLTTGDSWVELRGVSGRLGSPTKNVNTTYSGNVILTNADDGTPALSITNSNSGSPGTAHITTLTGNISGTGDIERKIGNGNNLTFAGDISGWTGTYYNGNQAGTSNSGWNVVTFTQGGEINASFVNKAYTNGCYLTLNFNGDNTIVKGTLSTATQALNVNANANTTFTGTVNVNTLTVAQGKTATMATDAIITGITNNGTLEIAKEKTLTFNAANYNANFGKLKLNDGATLLINNQNRTETHTIGSITLADGATGTINHKEPRYNAKVNIGTLVGDSDSTLNLWTTAKVDLATVYEMNGGDGSNFNGTIVLSQKQDGTRRLAMNINSGAATQLQNSIVKFSGSGDANAQVGLGVHAENVTVKGIVSDTPNGKHYIFSGAAENNKNTDLNYVGDNVDRTLTINTGDSAEASYSTRAWVGSHLNLVKEGAGTQTFTGDMSAFRGNITVNNGTLALSSTVASADSVSVTGGTLDLGAALTTTGSLSVASDATLKFAGAEMLTVGDNLTLAGNLDVSNITYTQGATVTLASYTGEANYAGATITGLAAGQTGTLGVDANKHLTLTFGGQPEPKEGTFHVYVLTGQSNSLGAVKGNPLSAELLAAYQSQHVKMWDANMGGSVTGGDNMETAWNNEGKTWIDLQQSRTPGSNVAGTDWEGLTYPASLVGTWGGSLVMGPEYGFGYMLEKKGWFLEGDDGLGVIKASRDGGGDSNWEKGQKGYSTLLNSIKLALDEAKKLGCETVSLDGLMYLQGESNGSGGTGVQERYLALLSNLKQDLTEEGYDASKLTFDTNSVLGEIATWDQTDTYLGRDKNNTVEYQEALADSRADIGYVHTRDLDKITQGDNMGVHYNGEAQLTIGARYAYAFAVQKGIDVGTVRGDNDEVNLNEAGAWWMNQLPGQDAVVVWDLSSVSTPSSAAQLAGLGNNIAAGQTLTVGGVRIEDPYKQGVIINGGTMSIGSSGIELQGGDLSISSTIEARATQTWNTVYTPDGGTQQNHLLTTSGTVNIASGATLTIAENSRWQFNVVQGTGNLVINDGVTLAMTETDLGNHAVGGSGYSDGNNGFLAGRFDLITLTGDGAISVNVNNISKAGALADKNITLSQDGKVLQILNGESTVYHVRDGVVVYDTAPRITGAASININDMGSTGATLELATGLANNVTVTSSGNGGAIKIDNGVTLNQSSLGTLDAAVQLTGEGVLALNAATHVLPNHLNLKQGADGWTGIVSITGDTFNGSNLNGLANGSYSTIRMHGVTGWTEQWNGSHLDFNIDLEDNGNTPAWNFNAGSSTAQTYIVLNGDISGSGTLKKTADQNESFKFAGDLSNWIGSFVKEGSGTSVLHFMGDADTVKISTSRSGGKLGLSVETDATFTGNIAGVNNGLTVTPGHHATFTGNTNIEGDSSIGGTVYNGGTMTLGGTVTVNAGDLRGFELYKAGTQKEYSGEGTYAGSGYLTTDSQYYLVKNETGATLNFNASASGEGITVTTAEDGVSRVFQSSNPGTVYYVNKDLSYDANEMLAKTTAYVVAEGKTFKASGANLAGKDLVLEQGSTWQSNAATSFNNQQVQALILHGDAAVTASNNCSIAGASATGASSMSLGGYTLSVNGSNHFALFNTTAADAGTIQVNNGGFLQVGHSQKTSSADLKDVVVNIASGGHLTVDNDSTITVEGIEGNGTIQMDGGNGGTIIIENNLGTDCTFSGSISSTPNLVMDAASTGKQTLNLSNSATLGRVTVNGGTLELGATTGTLTMGAVTLNSGTLDLDSTVTAGALTVNGGTLILAGANQLATSSLILGGASRLDLANITWTTGTESITLASTTGGISGDLSNVTLTNWTAPTGYTSTLEKQGNNLVLTFTHIDNSLIWDAHGDNKWSTLATDLNWHAKNKEEGSSYFSAQDSVSFESGTWSPILQQDITAGNVDVQSGASVTVDGNSHSLSAREISIAANGSLTTTGALDANTITVGGTLTTNGVLDADSISLNGSLTAGGNTDYTLDAALSGSGSLTKTGSSTIILSGDNYATNYSGAIVIDSGTLKVGANNALGKAASITVNPNGTLDVNGKGDGNTQCYDITLAGGTLTNSVTGPSHGSKQLLKGITLTANSTVSGTGQYGLIAGGYGATTLNLGEYTLEKTGTGTFFMTNTTATGTGTLKISQGAVDFNQSKPGSGAFGVNIEMAGGRVTSNLNLGNNIRITTTDSNSSFAANLNLKTYTATFAGSEDLPVSGIISGTGSVVKEGDGTLKLTGANTYSGSTTVNGGTLLVSGATSLTSTSGVTVNSGGTLQFDAALGANARSSSITVAGSSGSLPGGTLTFGGVDDNALNVTGALTLGSGSVLDVSNLNFTDETGQVILAKTTGGITPTDLSSVKIEGQGGFGYTLSLDGNNLVLDYESSIKTLIWRGASSNVWMNESREKGTNKNWFTANNPGKNIPFSDYDRVRFASNASVQLGSDIESGRMLVDNNRSVTVDTKGYALSVDYIEGAGGSLTVKGTDDQTQATRIQGSTTLKNLTLDNGTASLGGHTEVSEKLTVKNDAEVTVSGTMATKALDISGGSSVSLAAGGTALTTKVEGASTLTVGANSSLGQLTLNSGTVTNNATLTLSNTQDTIVSGTSRITGTGTTITTGIRLADNSTLTIDGGQTVSITTDHGIIGGTGNGSVLTLGNVTMTGTASWSVADTVDSVNLTSTTDSGTVFDTNAHSVTVNAGMSGTGNLTKTGHGTLTLNGSNSFSGDTTVSAGTLKVNKADGLTSSANVNVADGATLWFNSPTTANISGNTVIADGGTLHLGSENALTTTTGTLTLNGSSVLNLSGLEITKGKTEYVLASGKSITLASGFDMDDVIVEYGTHPETGSTPSIIVRPNTKTGLEELVLTYDVINSNSLYWTDAPGTPNWTDAGKWHDVTTKDPTTFAKYDDVFFAPSEYSEPSVASVQANVTQNTNVHDMHIVAREGEGAAKNTVNVVVNSGQTLTVDFLNADVNTAFIKEGAGTAIVGIDDSHFGADVSVTDGTLTTQFLDLAGNGMVVDGVLNRTGGTLNLEVGRAETPTDVEFRKSVSGVKNFTVNEGSNATFTGQVIVPDRQDIYMDVASDASVTFKHDVSLASNSWVIQGDGTVNFDGPTVISEVSGHFNQLNGNAKVNFNSTLSTAAAEMDIRLDPGTNLYIKELDMVNGNQDTLYFTFKNTSGTQVDRDSVQIDKMVVDGSRGIGTNLSSLSGLEDYQAGGDINIKQLVNASGETSDDIARLCNYVSRLQAKVTPNGWGIAQVFNLGGATEESTAFQGIIRLQDSRNDENWYGSADNHKKSVVVLEDEYVASGAVIELKNYAQNSDFGIGVNAVNAKVQGIRDYASDSYQHGNRSVIFSGPMDAANTAIPESDDTVRTLELTGKSGDTRETEYVASAGVDKNLNIVKKGLGTQVFSGDSSKFNASIEVQEGVLEFSNTASLYIEDLTLGKDKVQQPALMKSAPLKALGSDAANVDTLAVRTDAAGANVGMAEVHGTLKAKSGAALDSNLTLASGSKLDVRDTLSAKTNPEMTDKTDYVGGLNMLGHSITLQGGAYLSDADRSALLSMQWGERYELAYNLSSLTLGSTTYTTDSIEFIREDYLNKNIEASKYFENLQEANYYICYSGSEKAGPGSNVGTLYIFKAPEPTTSTLSLLALAALAARRRRK